MEVWVARRKLENRVALKKLYAFSRRADAAAPGRQNIQCSDIKTESFDNECKQSVRTSHVQMSDCARSILLISETNYV